MKWQLHGANEEATFIEKMKKKLHGALFNYSRHVSPCPETPPLYHSGSDVNSIFFWHLKDSIPSHGSGCFVFGTAYEAGINKTLKQLYIRLWPVSEGVVDNMCCRGLVDKSVRVPQGVVDNVCCRGVIDNGVRVPCEGVADKSVRVPRLHMLLQCDSTRNVATCASTSHVSALLLAHLSLSLSPPLSLSLSPPSPHKKRMLCKGGCRVGLTELGRSK